MGRGCWKATPWRSSPRFDAAPDAPNAIDLHGRRHEGFAKARTAQGVNLFDKVAEHVKDANAAGRRVVVAGYTEGSASRLQHLLQEHGATTPVPVADSPRCSACRRARSASPSGRSSTASCSRGSRSSARRTSSATACRGRPSKRRPSERFIAEASALSEGDLVVHREHGVGRYEGLVTLEIQHARHDCLRLTYEGGDKLFVPVENIDVLSRYGAAEEGAAARPAGRRRLAVAQGAAQAAHRRHGRPADRDRRRARRAVAARR